MDGLYNHEKMAEEILNYLNEGMKGVTKMFDQQKIAQTVLNLAKDYTNTTMQVMKTSWDMYEKTLDTLVKQGSVAQDEGQKLMSDWMTRAKQGQQQYWNMMEENMKKMETHFNHSWDNTGHKKSTK